MIKNSLILLLFLNFSFSETGIFNSSEKITFGIWGSYVYHSSEIIDDSRIVSSDIVFPLNGKINIGIKYNQFDTGAYSNDSEKILSLYFKNNNSGLSFNHIMLDQSFYGDNPDIASIKWFNSNGITAELTYYYFDTYFELHTYDSEGNHNIYGYDAYFNNKYLSIGKYIQLKSFILGLEYKNLLDNFNDLDNGQFMFKIGKIL